MKRFSGYCFNIFSISYFLFLKFTHLILKNSILNITYEKLVSIDFNHNPASSIIDASLTNVVGSNMGKISAWYDNEWGFSNRMCDIAQYIHKNF